MATSCRWWACTKATSAASRAADVGAGKFTLFYLRGNRMLAAASVNRPGDFLMAKRLVAEQTTVDAAAMADEAVPLKSMLARAA